MSRYYHVQGDIYMIDASEEVFLVVRLTDGSVRILPALDKVAGDVVQSADAILSRYDEVAYDHLPPWVQHIGLE
jgi:hypothetical protein